METAREYINGETLGEIAGDIEKLLLEKREVLEWAMRKMADGIKVSIGLHLNPTAEGIEVDYAIAFPLEPTPAKPLREKATLKKTIITNQTELPGISVEVRREGPG